MSQVFRVDGIDLGDTVVRLGSEAGFTQLFELGNTGSSTVIIDDPAGTLDIPAWKSFTVDENSAPSGNQRVFTGYVKTRTIRRGDGSRPSLRTGAARQIEVELVELNAIASEFRVVVSGKRPKETASARIAWLLASGYLDVFDNGLVETVTTSLDAADYTDQRPSDVLGDVCVNTARNWSIYYDESADQASLWYGDTNTSPLYTSSLQISNVLADVDNSTTWAPLYEGDMVIDPSRVFQGVSEQYKNGRVYVRLTTGNGRDGIAPNSNVGTKPRATAIANQFLADAATEDYRLTVSLLIPAANVNDVLVGQLISAKFSHLSPYDDWSDFRVLRKSTAQDQETDQLYTLGLELSPATPITPGSIVQWGFVTNSGNLSLPNPVTIGNVLIAMELARKDGASAGTPDAPNITITHPRFGPGAWTCLAGNTGGSPTEIRFKTDGSSTWDNGGGAAVYAKIADSTERIGQIGGGVRFVSCVLYELTATTLAGITIVAKDFQTAGSTLDIGSLGTTTSKVALILAGYNGQATTTVTHPAWTRDLHCDPWQGNFGGDTSIGSPWAGFSRAWYGHTITTGAALEATVSINNAHNWCGIGIVIP